MSHSSPSSSNLFSVAVVGASGVVGRLIVKLLIEKEFPLKKLSLFTSHKSAGNSVLANGKPYIYEELTEQELFKGFDFVFFAAGSTISQKYAPRAAEAGAIVIDNSSFFRLDPQIPLVVSEVNSETLFQKTKPTIIANPNCTTMQMVVALKPLHDRYQLKRVDLVSFQAVSGRGQQAIEEFIKQMRSYEILTHSKNSQEFLNFTPSYEAPQAFAHPIAFNCLPHIDSFRDDGFTGEEFKVMHETRKILNLPQLKVSATCVRVPVLNAHSESVAIETEKPIDLNEARELLKNAPGIVLLDDPTKNEYPLAMSAAGKDPVFVGRLRHHPSAEKPGHGLLLWIVADNLRKGAALNAVDVAMKMVNKS